PRRGENIVLEDDGMIGWIVVGRQHRAVPDDVASDVGARAITWSGQRHAVIGKVEGRDVGRQTGAAFFRDMDEGVVGENKTSGARRGSAFVQRRVIDVV